MMRSSIAVALLVTVPSAAAAQISPPTFLAVDIDAGIMAHNRNNPLDDSPRYKGWRFGAHIRPLRWAGLAVEAGQSTADERTIQHYLMGGRLVGSFELGRSFAHALVGVARARGSTASPDTGLEFVTGGGFDLFFLRFQVDYMRVNVANVPRNQVRGALSGVLPLCFRGCQGSWDGFDLSK